MSSTASKNAIQRFLFINSDIRGEILTLSSSFLDACNAQDLPLALRPLFGEFVAGVSLVGEMLKFDGLITLQARGEGPVALVMSEANHHGHFRGLVQADPEVTFSTSEQSEKPIGELIGKGVLAMTLDPEQGQRYQGIVPLDGKNLAECLTLYFEKSEQVPTFILLFSDENQCGGILLQCLPAQEITDIETREALWQTVTQLCATVKAEEFFATDHETLLYRLFHELECMCFPEKTLEFKCSCSRERSENAIASLGTAEITDMVNEGNPIDIACHLCGQNYVFSVEEIRALLNNSQTLH